MADRTCEIEGCGRPHVARGFCARHWARWRTHGDANIARHPYAAWTPEEDEQVRSLAVCPSGDLVRKCGYGDAAALAARLGRTVRSVRMRLWRIRRRLLAERQATAAALAAQAAGQWALTPAQIAAMRAEAAAMRPAGTIGAGPSVAAVMRDPPETGDRPLDRPERPCACCGNPFQPTLRRRLLCVRCWRRDGRASGRADTEGEAFA